MTIEQWIERGSEWQLLFFFAGVPVLMLLERWRRLRAREAPIDRWCANFALTAINVVALGALPVSLIGTSVHALRADVGLLNLVDAAGPIAFVATLLLRGFISWFTHFLMHKVPPLWRIHRVHHLDTDLDVSTTVRFHPLEFVVALAIGVPLVLALGLSPVALVVYELLDVVVTLLSHANIRLAPRLHRALSPIIVTPDLHRIHHSARWPETDRNFGAVFPVWDILFRTWQRETDRTAPEMTLGLHAVRDERTRQLRWLLGVPFRSLGRGPRRDTHGSRSAGGQK